jgi:putative transposase
MQAEYTAKTDAEWQVIEKILNINRKRKHDLRKVFNAICWIAKTGIQCRELAKAEYPPWQVVYYYFRTWKKKGAFFAAFISIAFFRLNFG